MSREAMQMALHTLEGWANYGKWVWPESALEQAKRNTTESIAALRQALETEQEPVAWLKTWSDGSVSVLKTKSHAFADHELEPLYTAPPKRDLTCVCGAVWEGEMMVHPPRKREWVGLTHPQIHELDWPDGVSFEDILLFVRAIEQALKEKNT